VGIKLGLMFCDLLFLPEVDSTKVIHRMVEAAYSLVECLSSSSLVALASGGSIPAGRVTKDTVLLSGDGESVAVHSVVHGTTPRMFELTYAIAEGASSGHRVTPEHRITLYWATNPSVTVATKRDPMVYHYVMVTWVDRITLRVMYKRFRFLLPGEARPKEQKPDNLVPRTLDDAIEAAADEGDRLLYDESDTYDKATVISTPYQQRDSATYVRLHIRRREDGFWEVPTNYAVGTDDDAEYSAIIPVNITAEHARELVSEWFLRAETAGRARPLRRGDLFERYPHEVQDLLKSLAQIRKSVRIPAFPLKGVRVDPRSGPLVTLDGASASSAASAAGAFSVVAGDAAQPFEDECPSPMYPEASREEDAEEEAGAPPEDMPAFLNSFLADRGYVVAQADAAAASTPLIRPRKTEIIPSQRERERKDLTAMDQKADGETKPAGVASEAFAAWAASSAAAKAVEHDADAMVDGEPRHAVPEIWSWRIAFTADGVIGCKPLDAEEAELEKTRPDPGFVYMVSTQTKRAEIPSECSGD
jgi:hypothetical protein